MSLQTHAGLNRYLPALLFFRPQCHPRHYWDRPSVACLTRQATESALCTYFILDFPALLRACLHQHPDAGLFLFHPDLLDPCDRRLQHACAQRLYLFRDGLSGGGISQYQDPSQENGRTAQAETSDRGIAAQPHRALPGSHPPPQVPAARSGQPSGAVRPGCPSCFCRRNFPRGRSSLMICCSSQSLVSFNWKILPIPAIFSSKSASSSSR